MLTIDDFRKLASFDDDNHLIFVDGSEAYGLSIDDDLDPDEFVDGCEEMKCTFMFTLDRFGTVQNFTEFRNAKWTVVRQEEIDWKAGAPANAEAT